MLGRYNFYTCEECHQKKLGTYFISPTLCKKCAAERRLPVDNPIIKLEEGVAVTKRVKNRLEKEAGAKIPKTFRDKVVPFVVAIIIGLYIGLWWVGIPLWRPDSIFIWLGFWIASPLLAFPILLVINWLTGPRRKKIGDLTIELAMQRQQEIEATQQFYASPEWRYLRKKIIEEHKNVCQLCGKIIRNPNDITIDHILPRSKYPNLALEPTNLQVLCRSCNASKSNFVPP